MDDRLDHSSSVLNTRIIKSPEDEIRGYLRISFKYRICGRAPHQLSGQIGYVDPTRFLIFETNIIGTSPTFCLERIHNRNESRLSHAEVEVVDRDVVRVGNSQQDGSYFTQATRPSKISGY